MNLKEIKNLSSNYTEDQLNKCIIDYSNNNKQECELIDSEDIIGDLSKAAYIRSLMETQELSQREAIRELASRMRQFS